MVKKKTLSSLRITDKTYESMIHALMKINDASYVSFSLNEFRRLSYEYFAQLILRGEDLNLLIKK